MLRLLLLLLSTVIGFRVTGFFFVMNKFDSYVKRMSREGYRNERKNASIEPRTMCFNVEALRKLAILSFNKIRKTTIGFRLQVLTFPLKYHFWTVFGPTI